MSYKNVDFSSLTSGSEGLKPMADGEPEVVVQVNFLPPFHRWVDDFHGNAVAAAVMAGGELLVTLQEFKSYVRTLINVRVDYVRGRRPLFRPVELIRVPSFLCTTLAGLGDVLTEDNHTWLKPEHTEPEENYLSMSEMTAISNRLGLLEQLGYTFASGYDRDKRGSYDLMAQQYIIERDGVFSHTKNVEVAFAPVAMFLGLQQLDILMGTRIRTGYASTLANRLTALAQVDRRAG